MSASSQSFAQSSTPQQKDYDKILGVTESASPNEIKKAYRKMALSTHPDKNKNPTASDNFLDINQAYEVLGDPSKRQRYDWDRRMVPSSMIQATGRFFGAAMTMFSNVMHAAKWSAMNLHFAYQTLFEENPARSNYIKLILQTLAHGEFNPTTILWILLNDYMGSQQSTLTFYGRRLPNLAFMTKLLANVKRGDSLTVILQCLNTENNLLLEDHKFNALWSAFFTIFPLYLVDITQERFHRALQVKSLDEMIFKSILQPRAQRKKPVVLETDILLFSETNSFGSVITHLLQMAEDGEEEYRAICWGSLATVVKAAPLAEKATMRLSSVLQKLTEEVRLSSTIEHCYQIMQAAFEYPHVEFIQTSFLPLLKTKVNDLNHKHGIYTILAVVGRQVSLVDLETEILPLLLQGVREENSYFQVAAYKSLAEIFDRIPDASMLTVVLPALENGIETQHSEIYQLTAAMLTQIEDKSSRPVCASVLEALNIKLHTKLARIMLHGKYDDLYCLEWLLIFADQQTLNEKILPWLRGQVNAKPKSLYADASDALHVISLLPTTRVSDEFKEYLFENYLAQIKNSDDKIALFAIVGKFIRYSTKENLQQDFLNLLLESIDFEESRFSNAICDAAIKALVQVVNVIDKNAIQNQLIVFLLEKLFSSSRPENVVEILKVAMMRVDPDYAVKEILPRLFKNMDINRYYIAELANLLMPYVSYPERVSYGLLLCPTASESRGAETAVLAKIYSLNRQDLASHRQQADLNHLQIIPFGHSS